MSEKNVIGQPLSVYRKTSTKLDLELRASVANNSLVGFVLTDGTTDWTIADSQVAPLLQFFKDVNLQRS